MKLKVVSKKFDLQMADGVCDAFFTRPEKPGKYPAVLFLMDAFGLRPYLSEMAEILASNGYLVLQPNILFRAKRSPMLSLSFPLKVEDLPAARDEIIPLAKGFDYELGLTDAQFYLDYLSAQTEFNGKIGVTGYCMGGGLALRVAARFPERVQAAASFHAGRLVTEAPDSPHHLLAKIKAQIYVAHADNDGSMSPEQIHIFAEALLTSKIRGHAELYRGALHGFTMADLPAYNAEALSKHWIHLLGLFRVALS
jgi:carboxymethylenebutenolidase